jgi:hypothetical protein
METGRYGPKYINKVAERPVFDMYQRVNRKPPSPGERQSDVIGHMYFVYMLLLSSTFLWDEPLLKNLFFSFYFYFKKFFVFVFVFFEVVLLLFLMHGE